MIIFVTKTGLTWVRGRKIRQSPIFLCRPRYDHAERSSLKWEVYCWRRWQSLVSCWFKRSASKRKRSLGKKILYVSYSISTWHNTILVSEGEVQSLNPVQDTSRGRASILFFYMQLRPRIQTTSSGPGKYWCMKNMASVWVYSNCQCSSVFCLSLTYCSIYFGQTCSHLLENSCPLCVSLVLFLFQCRLNCRCCFPVWCLGQNMEFNCICSWSLPFYLFWSLYSLGIKYISI